MAGSKLTIQRLIGYTVKSFGRERFKGFASHISSVQIIPYVGTKSVLFTGEITGSSGRGYKMVMMFSDIKFHDKGRVTVEYKGDTYKFDQIKADKNPVKVRCSGSDFVFTFAYYNRKYSALYGPRPKTYTRKTKDRPPRNPHETPGICKHLYYFLGQLVSNGYVV